MNKTLTLLAVVLATAATSFAGTASSSKKVVVAPQQDLFRAGEVQVDAFVAGAAGNYNQTVRNGRRTTTSSSSTTGMGGGLGLSYFLTKYFGIGIDDTLGSLNGNGQTYNSTQGTLSVVSRSRAGTLLLTPSLAAVQLGVAAPLRVTEASDSAPSTASTAASVSSLTPVTSMVTMVSARL